MTTSQRTASDEEVASGEALRRHTVHEAALLLGLSVDAVRKRAERGRLKREKAPDGTVYILLDTNEPAGQEANPPASNAETVTRQDALVDSLQNQIEYLRRELEIRNQELRRKDHLLAAAIERIPELEAFEAASPRDIAPTEDTEEPRASSEAVEETVAPTSMAIHDAQQSSRQRSWLYRFFFGP
jgi:hypothetical protein